MKELKDGIFWNGVFDPNLRIFDIIMETEFGTSYNAYVVKGSDKTALIESAKACFAEDYFERLKKSVDLKTIDYLVVNHTENDHTGSIQRVLSENPNIEIVGSTAGIQFLKEMLNCDFNAYIVKDGEEIALGGKTLRFILAPNLHWPDSMFTYLAEDHVLFSCDSFGAHYTEEGALLRSEVKHEADYLRAAKYYYDMILSPFRSFMRKALDKIKDLEIDLICTGHGPILDQGINQWIETYREWSEEIRVSDKQAVIAYVSAYGYTRDMALAIAEGLRKGGVTPKIYNLVEDDSANLASDILTSGLLLIGSPTILSDALKPVYDLLSTLNPVIHGGKMAVAFGSYGWSGEAVQNLTQRFAQLRFKAEEGIKIRFKPSQEQLAECEDFGFRLSSRMQNA